jgi:hypothetical protein
MHDTTVSISQALLFLCHDVLVLEDLGVKDRVTMLSQ